MHIFGILACIYMHIFDVHGREQKIRSYDA